MYSYMNQDVQMEMRRAQERMNDIHDEYFQKTAIFRQKETIMEVKDQKIFYNLINTYCNSVNKELNKLENLFVQEMRTTSIFKTPEVKKSLTIDYVETKKAFIKENDLLKKKLYNLLNPTR